MLLLKKKIVNASATFAEALNQLLKTQSAVRLSDRIAFRHNSREAPHHF
jgi:hypothetical protein